MHDVLLTAAVGAVACYAGDIGFRRLVASCELNTACYHDTRHTILQWTSVQLAAELLAAELLAAVLIERRQRHRN